MAALFNSWSEAISVYVNRFVSPIFKSNSRNPFQLSPFLRYSSTQQTKNTYNDEHGDDNDKEHNVKFKSSTKTKKARIMAQRINDKPWSDDLESSPSTLSPSLSKTTVLQTLQLIRNPAKALKFFKWTQENGYTHNDQSYFMMLEILGRSHNLNAARNFLYSIEKKSGGAVKLEDKFFNSLIRNYGQAGLFKESIKVLLKMKSIGVSPSVVTYNSLLSILLRRGRTSMARRLYDEMLVTYGVAPDTVTFNILIKGFCMNSMVDEGFQFFKEMSRFGCDPDVITYNTLVDGLCRARKVTTAHNVLRGMLKKSLDMNPNVVTYTTLIRGYCMKHDIADALVVFEEMVSRGLKPNRITYNTLIQGLCEAQKFDKVKMILEVTLAGGKFIPDTCTFNTLMNVHCIVGNVDEALKVFDKMLDLKVQPDSASYSVLIRSLSQRGDLHRAVELFDELSEKQILLREDGCTPLVAAYNPMFEYLCGNGNTQKAETVFRQLLKRGTQDRPSYKTLIMGHCREGTFEAGYELLVLMLRRDFVPDAKTYESLIDGLLKKGNPVLAQKTLEKMLRSFHLAATSTFHSILDELLKKGCAIESANLVRLMLEKRIRLNINLSTHTVQLLFKDGIRDKAFEIIGLIYENGFSVKMEDLVSSLCQRKKLLEAREMLIFSLEKDQNVDIDVCSTVICGLCEIRRLSEAFGLYYALVEKGNLQQLSCIEDLKVALQADGRLTEAKFVSKRMRVNVG